MGEGQVVLRSSPAGALWGLAGALFGAGVCVTLATVVSPTFLAIAVVWFFLAVLIGRLASLRATLTLYREGFVLTALGGPPVHQWWENCSEFVPSQFGTIMVRPSDATGALEPTMLPAGLGGYSAAQLVALLDSFRQAAPPTPATRHAAPSPRTSPPGRIRRSTAQRSTRHGRATNPTPPSPRRLHPHAEPTAQPPDPSSAAASGCSDPDLSAGCDCGG
jgi:hypothetical protein